jgi:hypothetical protein
MKSDHSYLRTTLLLHESQPQISNHKQKTSEMCGGGGGGVGGQDRHGKQGQKHIKGTRAGTALNDASSRCNSRGPITRFQNVKVSFTVNTHLKTCLIEPYEVQTTGKWQHAARVTIIRDCFDSCIGNDCTTPYTCFLHCFALETSQ